MRNRVPFPFLIVLLVIPRVVAGQDDDRGLRPNHLTVSGGMMVNGGQPLGDRNAELRQSGAGQLPPSTLFRAESELQGARGVEARVGFALTRALAIEVGGSYSKPTLAVTISQDPELDDAIVIQEQVEQYTVDVSGVYQLPGLKLGSRARPYASVGGGYLRQRHEDHLLVETGRLYHIGLGVRYWLRGGSASSRALGMRADARFVRRAGGVDFEDRSRNYPSFSLLVFAGF